MFITGFREWNMSLMFSNASKDSTKKIQIKNDGCVGFVLDYFGVRINRIKDETVYKLVEKDDD